MSGPGVTENGAQIRQWDDAGGANQQWQVISIDNTGYKIVSRVSGKVLDVHGGAGATGNSLPVQQWDYFGNPNQQWQLVPLQ